MNSAEKTMVVVNMARSLDDVRMRIYLCPSMEAGFRTGYAHKPSRYLACYVSSGAKYVGAVEACVRLGLTKSTVLWKFSTATEDDLVSRARQAQRNTTSGNKPPCLVFLLEDLKSTDFQYDVGGGLQNSCVFFDLSPLDPANTIDLAAKLRGVTWSELRFLGHE